MISDAIVVALITGTLSLTGTLMGTYYSQKRTTALITYRIEQLEKKVEVHNNLIDRMYRVEERTEVQDTEIKVVNRRLDALEKG